MEDKQARQGNGKRKNLGSIFFVDQLLSFLFLKTNLTVFN